jgi:hypothetical protein
VCVCVCVCVYAWALHASGVTRLWFPLSFVIVRVREDFHGTIIRDIRVHEARSL